MTYPTPYTVGWHTASQGSSTGRNIPTITHTPDLESSGTLVKVMGWAPTQTREPTETRVESDIDLFVPPGVSAKPNDVVDLPVDKSFGVFEVVGYGEDWTKGPFGFNPGSVVRLKRVQH